MELNKESNVIKESKLTDLDIQFVFDDPLYEYITEIRSYYSDTELNNRIFNLGLNRNEEYTTTEVAKLLNANTYNVISNRINTYANYINAESHGHVYKLKYNHVIKILFLEILYERKNTKKHILDIISKSEEKQVIDKEIHDINNELGNTKALITEMYMKMKQSEHEKEVIKDLLFNTVFTDSVEARAQFNKIIESTSKNLLQHNVEVLNPDELSDLSSGEELINVRTDIESELLKLSIMNNNNQFIEKSQETINDLLKKSESLDNQLEQHMKALTDTFNEKVEERAKVLAQEQVNEALGDSWFVRTFIKKSKK